MSNWGFPNIRGLFSWNRFKKDHNILESVLGPLVCGNSKLVPTRTLKGNTKSKRQACEHQSLPEDAAIWSLGLYHVRPSKNHGPSHIAQETNNSSAQKAHTAGHSHLALPETQTSMPSHGLKSPSQSLASCELQETTTETYVIVRPSPRYVLVILGVSPAWVHLVWVAPSSAFKISAASSLRFS